MLVQLATDVDDPIERLEIIHENTVRSKTYQNALGAKTLAKMAEIVPFGVANRAARLYSRFELAELHNPIANCTITNVPGPQFPMYLSGHKLLAIMGLAPIIDGMGLIITIFSYDGLVTVTSTSDAGTMPDIREFSIYIREAANELETAVLQRGKKKKKRTADRTDTQQIDAFFTELKKSYKARPDTAPTDEGVYNFRIVGEAQAEWKIDFGKKPTVVRRGKAAKPVATLELKDRHLYRVAQGDLTFGELLIQGRLKVEGDQERGEELAETL